MYKTAHFTLATPCKKDENPNIATPEKLSKLSTTILLFPAIYSILVNVVLLPICVFMKHIGNFVLRCSRMLLASLYRHCDERYKSVMQTWLYDVLVF